jgi:hypothetical protein
VTASREHGADAVHHAKEGGAGRRWWSSPCKEGTQRSPLDLAREGAPKVVLAV